MTIRKFLVTGFFGLIAAWAAAQSTFPVNGVRDDRDKAYAFTHATIVVAPGNIIQDGVMVIQQGRITYVGTDNSMVKDAVVRNMNGKYIYASFVDMDADYGIPAKSNPPAGFGPQMNNNFNTALNWNQAVTPEFNAYENFATDTSNNKMWRNAGFGTVLTSRHDGILRGTGALVMLGNEPSNLMLMNTAVSNHYSFMKGSSTQDYPSSEMGSIALIRQTLYDADWYAKGGNKQEKNISLEAVNANKPLIQIFEVKDKYEILRADKIGDEFNFQFVVKGSGNEYQRLDEIKKTNAALIIPVVYPKTPDVSDPYDAELISLADLKHWEMAPANCAFLQQAGIPFCITSSGLENRADLIKNVRKAIQYGLNENDALAALTTTPARLSNSGKDIGTLEKGKLANFIITSDDIFKDNAVIYENWVNGKQYVVNPSLENDMRGIYKLSIDNRVYGLIVRGNADVPEFAIIKNTDTIKANSTLTDESCKIQFTDGTDVIRLSGWINGKNFEGNGQINERWIPWKGEFTNVYADKKQPEKIDSVDIGKICYPFTAFGWETAPKQQDILITNTTVWTNEKEGVLKNTDVLISGGRIVKIGKNIAAKNAMVIDGAGKHLTAGIIDEHSHIAIYSGVNEGTQSSSAEVRIGDVVNPEDINIYRQLSGGVTSAHLLHGSANPIGGQTQLIKLRWGLAPEDMKFSGWPGFIKFALGENVKQSNWGDFNVVRFPQTRMGVEQVYEDEFTRAEAYIKAMQDPAQLVRRDLELDAIAEILQHKRFITCHSYVQSEINMLMKVADEHHFTVNTFTHILEGYKVADKMKQHGAGASTFSDWWAYKYEVYEAIPQNAGILTKEGVVTAINSDDAEMGRRLNQEAAKSIKYMGLSEEEALKLCTLNPAILLHVDDRVGSIKEGKDADLVLWSDDPLSIYAVAEKTMVDGVIYYDRSQAAATAAALQKERARIIAKMIAEKNRGGATVPVQGKKDMLYDCDTQIDFMSGF